MAHKKQKNNKKSAGTEALPLLKRSGLLDGLSDKEMKQAVAVIGARQVTFEDQVPLFEKGAVAARMWVIESGRVAIRSASGETMQAHHLASTVGAVTGEQGILEPDRPRQATMIAEGPVTAWEITAKGLSRMSDAQKSVLCHNLCRILLRKLRACRVKGQAYRKQVAQALAGL
jgi:CRP-like cAMP-binding protein